jgi:TPP-dependent indolepyruvate ferredoxin oxidoreductase alpha subunit
MQTVVDCCKLSHTHNTGLMIVKNLPRILLQQNTKNKKTRRRRRRRRRRRKRTRNWVTLRIGCQQCRSCEICKDFHCKKISPQERKKKKKKRRRKKKRDVVIRVFPNSIVKKVTADCLLLVLNTKGQIGN